MSVWPTILTFFGAIIGAMIGATVGPLVQWKIEQKRERLSHRRDLIKRWRKMFEEMSRDPAGQSQSTDMRKLLARHADFLSLLMYSKTELPTEEESAKELLALGENVGVHPIIAFYMKETIKLEKEWGLL
jgi:hypothetical protein